MDTQNVQDAGITANPIPTIDIEIAKKAIEDDKQTRITAFKAELDAIIQKYNINFEVEGEFKGSEVHSRIAISSN